VPYLLEVKKRGRRRQKKGLGARLLAVAVLAAALGGLLWWSEPKGPGGNVETGKANPARNFGVTNPAPAQPVSPPQAEAASSNPPPGEVRAPNLKPEPSLTAERPPKSGSAGFEGRAVQNVFEAQLALARMGISSGSLDGANGSQTRAALLAFQESRKLAATGSLDLETRQALRLLAPPYTTYAVESNDLARLQPLAPDWIGKSRQTRLDYESILELAAEKGWSQPGLIKQLNPGIDWTNVAAGAELRIPNVERLPARERVAFLRIHLSEKTLEAFDSETNLLLHFPCSIAQRVEKRPMGVLHVAAVALNPDYIFDPANFPESAEARRIGRKLRLPPGPKNPVGTAWIGLDKPGYGIHGSPRPELVGRTESHGCFRLANWNAESLARRVAVGTPVYVLP
jgi:lipoprotein-anchoring transpeptidase ErfK/SrfK